MRVALIFPEVYEIAKYRTRKEFPPFGVLYLAAALEHKGIDVRIFSVSSGKTELDLTPFDAVGFSIPSSVTYPLIRECRRKSSYARGALLMAGGVHVGIYPAQTLIDLQVDVVCLGEGDEAIVEILEALSSRQFGGIKGIGFPIHGNPVFTAPRSLLRDIDKLPLPSRHLISREDFILHNRLAKTNLRMTHIMFSRGCPFSCRFCASPQDLVQYRSGLSIRTELSHLKQVYEIDGFGVVDDNSIINKNKLHEICDSISDLNLKWMTVSRVDTVDRAALEAMRDAGCIEIAFGIESGSRKILASMGKGITPAQATAAVTLAHDVGISVKAFLIHGYPGENTETTRETISLLQQLAEKIQRVSLFRFVPLPGSYVYEHAHDFDLNLDPDEFEQVEWERFHIHHNSTHWWGTKDDFREVNRAYELLDDFVSTNWPSRHKNEYEPCLSSS